MNVFNANTLGKYLQIRIKKLISGHDILWKCYIQGAPERDNIIASLVQHLKFQE